MQEYYGSYSWGWDEKDIAEIPNKRMREWISNCFCTDGFWVVVNPNRAWWIECNRGCYPFCETVINYLKKYFKKRYNCTWVYDLKGAYYNGQRIF